MVTGRDLRNARPSLDENNLPAVSFTLNQDGARKFGTATEQNIGRQLAIVLDNRVFSAPVIQSRISDEGRISGAFTQQEAQDLSLVLRSGALPASLDLPRGAHGRPVARRRLDPRRRDGVDRRPAARRRSSCWSTTS